MSYRLDYGMELKIQSKKTMELKMKLNIKLLNFKNRDI